ADAIDTVKKIFEDVYVKTDGSYANARTVRNFFEKTIQRQANRLARDKTFTDKDLQMFTVEDFLRKTDAGDMGGKNRGEEVYEKDGFNYMRGAVYAAIPFFRSRVQFEPDLQGPIRGPAAGTEHGSVPAALSPPLYKNSAKDIILLVFDIRGISHTRGKIYSWGNGSAPAVRKFPGRSLHQ
ncbi:MAG: hypothetical protein LBE02_03215, partial [Spirochaetaceae bacterium]|nr:hypothetical protein [Spirochaetaceae bacterium]